MKISRTHVRTQKIPGAWTVEELRMFISSFPCNGLYAKVAVYLDVVSHPSETTGVKETDVFRRVFNSALRELQSSYTSDLK